MASKLLKETKDTEINNKKQKARVEKDDIYKIDLELEQDNQNTEQFTQHDEKEKPKKASKAKAQSTKKKTRAKKEDNIIKIEDDEDEIDEIFGNVNKWLKDAEEVIENKPKRKLAKIEEGIKSSKTAKSNKGTTKTRKNSKIEEIEKVEDVDIKEEPVQAENVEKIEKVDEIPETQGISLCTPPFGTGHTPRVMVEINAVKTVVVHHVGVQPAIRTMVDVLEEHAVQSPACVMGGASHANPHHGFDCRGNGAER